MGTLRVWFSYIFGVSGCLILNEGKKMKMKGPQQSCWESGQINGRLGVMSRPKLENAEVPSFL